MCPYFKVVKKMAVKSSSYLSYLQLFTKGDNSIQTFA